MLSLRQKWVRQKYEIMLETFRQKTDEDMKSKVFLKLCENIYQIKKKRYIDTVIKDFRKDTLLTKAFSGLKQCVRSRLMPQQIINYCTENMHTFETRDAFLEREQQLSMKQKVELDTSTCMFNEERIVASPQVPVNQEVQQTMNEDLLESHLTDNKDELLEDIYKRYIGYKSRMMKTR